MAESEQHITKTRLFKYIENFTSKNWKFTDKKLWYFFYISAQNIDCGYSLEPHRRGGSNEYSQSMILSRNKKNNVYPCKPQFYYIKVGFKGVKIILVCFRDELMTIYNIFFFFFQDTSRKRTYTNLNPSNPNFYIVKLGFAGVNIIFLISSQKHRLLGTR